MVGYFDKKGEDDFDWEEGRGETPTLGTGPSVDNTFETINGHYIYIGALR